MKASHKNVPPLYVSAYYHIPKRSMPHMGISRYMRLAPVSLKMIAGSKLVFFYEEDCIGEIVKKLCDDWQIDLVPIQLRLLNLPQRDAATIIAENARRSALPPESECTKEKGWSHMNGMIHGEDRTEYRDNLSIWLSKLDLVQNAIDRVGVEDRRVAWMDFGISKCNFMRSNWNFRALTSRFDRTKISHYGSSMRMNTQRLPLSAGFLSGFPEAWDSAVADFSTQLEAAKSDCYPHDEETIMSRVVQARPELFDCIGKPYTGLVGRCRYLVERFRAQGS